GAWRAHLRTVDRPVEHVRGGDKASGVIFLVPRRCSLVLVAGRREPYLLPGVATSALGTPQPPGSDSARAGSFATSWVDGPPSRLRASQHPSPPFSGASAR